MGELNQVQQQTIAQSWVPAPPIAQPRRLFVFTGAVTHQFAALAALTVGSRADQVAALASLEVTGGTGTIVLVDVISAAAAGPAAAPDGATLAGGTGPGDGGQGGLGAGGAPDAPDADSGGLGTAAVGLVYEARCQVVQQGSGVLLPVLSFKFDAEPGAMGSSLAVVLADPAATVNEDDRIRVRIGIQNAGATEWVKLVGGARIRETSIVTSYLGDVVSFKAVNPMRDKWARSPRRPLVLFDPEQVTLVELTAQQQRDIVDADREVITPEFEPRESFDLQQLLEFVYVTKCGFSQVITNIPNFPLKRADFTLETTWHSIAAAEIGAFSPVYGSDDEDVLFILDPQGVLPEGLAAKKLKPRGYSQMSQVRDTAGMVNAVLLNYRDNTDTAGEFSGGESDRVDVEEPEEVGTYGQAGWQRTVAYSFHKLFHDNPNDPTDVTRDIVWKVDRHTSAVVDGIIREISIESQVDQWTEDWRLMIGYTKSIQIYTILPGTSAVMRDCETHVNVISYAVSQSEPGESYKTGETTTVTGTVLSTDNGDDPPTLISLYDAHAANSITDDQDVLLATPISSLIEKWKQIAPDQIAQQYTKINQLTGVCTQSKTFIHTGTLAVRTGAQTPTARMLLTSGDIPEEEARPPLQFNSGNIPYDIARPLAERLLELRGAKPRTISFELAGLDLSLRRGSLRRVFTRDGTKYLVFVTGYSVSGDPGPRGAIVLSMSGQGVVIGEE